MTEEYKKIQNKLYEIEGKQETIEKIRKRVLSEEDYSMNQTNQSLRQIEESSYEWRHDSKLQQLFYEQENLITGIQKKRLYFLEDWEEKINHDKKQLRQQEEDYQEKLHQLKMKEVREESNGTTT